MQSMHGERENSRAYSTTILVRGQLQAEIPRSAEVGARSLKQTQEDPKIPGKSRVARVGLWHP